MEIVRARADAPPSKGGAESASGAGAVAGDTEFVQQLLALHTRFSRLVDDVFAKHRVFQAAMNAAFDSFMNKVRGCEPSSAACVCVRTYLLWAGVLAGQSSIAAVARGVQGAVRLRGASAGATQRPSRPSTAAGCAHHTRDGRPPPWRSWLLPSRERPALCSLRHACLRPG